MTEFDSEAIILRHLDYGEADRIVTFLTPGYGSIRGFARGARKSRRRFGASLEPFAQVRMLWTPARSGGLVHLREAELLDLRAGLRADLTAVALAAYGCELVEALFGEGQAHAEVFDLLRAFLDQIARSPRPEARLLLELRLLQAAGYIPHLLHCSTCGETLRDPEVAFDAARGGSLCRECAGPGAPLRLSLPILGSLARCLRAPLVLFEEIRLSPGTLAEGHSIVAAALGPHLTRPLRTLIFLERVER
jgi:DNA repair protein RecO (recombination protein O)